MRIMCALRLISLILVAIVSLLIPPLHFSAKAVTVVCPRITANNITQLMPLQHIPDQKFIQDFQFSADNRLLTTVLDFQENAREPIAQQWEIATAHKRIEVKLYPSDNAVYRISPDGHYVAEGTAVVNGVLPTLVTVYDMQTGKTIFASKFYGRPSFFIMAKKTVVFFANGGDNSLYTFRWDTRHYQRIFDLRGDPIPDKVVVNISDDLRWVITVGIDIDFHMIGPWQLWDLSTGRERKDIYQDKDSQDVPHFSEFSKVRLSSDGHYLVVAEQGVIRIFDLKRVKQIAEFKAAGDSTLFSPDGRYTITYYQYGSESTSAMPIIDLATGKITVELDAKAEPLEFSPNSKSLLYSHEKIVHILNLETKADLSIADLDLDRYYGWWGLFSTDASLLGYFSNQKGKLTMTWRNLETNQSVASYDMVRPIKFSADGTLLAALNTANEIVIWGLGNC